MAEWYEEGGALNIKSGVELERFNLGSIKIHGIEYTILTGYESEKDICWWCGKPIVQGKRKAHYCRVRSHDDFVSCFKQYHRHFNWGYAAEWALERAGYRCENCGCKENNIRWGGFIRTNLEVHHIVPLLGGSRFFSAYNLPWNLIVFCRDCHLEVGEAMRPPKLNKGAPDTWEDAIKIGQGIMALCIQKR